MEELVRLAAFEWLQKQTEYDDVISRSILERGFEFQGVRITLVGPSGIWKPRVFSSIPLSITTTPKGPYEDSITEDGFLIYKYRGTDPFHRDNVGLREAMRKKIPLIYFHGIVPGRYLAVWPVFIIEDDPALLSFVVAVDERSSIQRLVETDVVSEDYYRRKYITSTVKSRLHQRSFRERVLAAYRNQCTFCRLKHSELLDAAHIIADGSEWGLPVVSNGLSLCKIHHAAFDRHLVGVSPEYDIVVREDVLEEIDGPMLKHGIQELHGQRLILPGSKGEWPDRNRLASRFEEFRGVV